jgi:hypothetical protein
MPKAKQMRGAGGWGWPAVSDVCRYESFSRYESFGSNSANMSGL